MLESVQRDEGWPAGVWPTGHRPHIVLFTGSREWGLLRGGVGEFPQAWVDHEIYTSYQSVGRLVARWTMGHTEFGGAKLKEDKVHVVEGLVVVQGGALGLDDHVARTTRTMANGQRRLSRFAYAQTWREPHLAPGLWLYTFHADWENRPRALAGPERNQRMLDETAPDHVLAFFAHGRAYGQGIRGGTNDMVRRAVAAGVPVDIYVANDRRWRKP